MPEAQSARRLHPRLRVVSNGDQYVNAVRSDGSATVACGLTAAPQEGGVPPAPALAAALRTTLRRTATMVEARIGVSGKPVRDRLGMPRAVEG